MPPPPLPPDKGKTVTWETETSHKASKMQRIRTTYMFQFLWFVEVLFY